MSKRITLSDFEIEQLVKALESLRDETSLSYQVVAVGKRFYSQLIAKIKAEPSTSKQPSRILRGPSGSSLEEIEAALTKTGRIKARKS